MATVAVVDSGSANLRSIDKALQRVGLRTIVTDEVESIANAGGVVFPGVGAYHFAMRLLQQKNLPPVLHEVIAAGKPFLGICLGLQLLFSDSEERGSNESELPAGLNILPGRVKKFPPALPVPHVGWNRVMLRPAAHPLFSGLPREAYFYFTHSYYVQPEDEEVVLATTEYGQTFTSAVACGNLLGVQFHPEKSGPAGLRLLANFGKIIADPTLLST